MDAERRTMSPWFAAMAAERPEPWMTVGNMFHIYKSGQGPMAMIKPKGYRVLGSSYVMGFGLYVPRSAKDFGHDSLHLLHWCLSQGNAFFSALYSWGLWIPADACRTMLEKAWNFVVSGLH